MYGWLTALCAFWNTTTEISGAEFMGFFGPGQDVDKVNVLPIRGVSPVEAKKLIREAISTRVHGIGGLRRSFQFFDRDGSGSISRAEFLDVLKHHGKCHLLFCVHMLRIGQ